MKAIFYISFALVFLSCAPKQTKPNFLFIIADDYGYHDLSCLGSEYYETPNIDRIANEGMVFTEGYATCRVCSPSRASIMSGKFPARHGITDWIGARSGEAWREKNRYSKLLPPEYVHALDSNYITMPEALQEAGYKTFFAGKWHIGDEGSWPEDHGFDINKGGWSVGGPKGGYFSPYENPKLTDGPAGENLSFRLANETVSFIKNHNSQNTGQPFLAYLSFYAVHGPIQTASEKWQKYRDKADEMGIADSAFIMGKFFPIRQTQDNPIYAGLVEHMDDAVGIVLNALEELQLAENTVVVFTSDNGGVAAGDAFSTCNAPLRGGKGYQFEGGIREPYFIKAPGITQPGSKCDVPVSGTDFYPTLLELAGANQKPNEHQDGVSLVPLLRGGSINERPLIWHYPHYGNQGGEPSSVIRKGKWKLIHYYEDGRKELYDLKADLSETTNVASQHTEIVKSLDKELFAYLKEVGARFPKSDPIYDAEKEDEHLKRVATKVKDRLEKQRLNFLSKDFDPKNNWWGSIPED
ncbi:sulfatase [Bacteroidales bacterium]|nr:sulfatase [Bacteroidales bacterium]